MTLPVAPVRDLLIGRLGLPTVAEALGEQLGSDVTGVGDATAVGQRRPKGFTLNPVVHGTAGDLDDYLAAQRMRRQLRSLMQNPDVRLAGLYTQFLFDTERNGWIIYGTANLNDTNGGAALGEYQLTVDQAFRTAGINTHRDGYRYDVTDLRDTVNTVDSLDQVQQTDDFTTIPSLPLAGLPVGASDVTVDDSPAPAATRTGQDGAAPLAVGAYVVVNAAVVSWERNEEDFNKGDVVVYDRRGNLRQIPTG